MLFYLDNDGVHLCAVNHFVKQLMLIATPEVTEAHQAVAGTAGTKQKALKATALYGCSTNHEKDRPKCIFYLLSMTVIELPSWHNFGTFPPKSLTSLDLLGWLNTNLSNEVVLSLNLNTIFIRFLTSEFFHKKIYTVCVWRVKKRF